MSRSPPTLTLIGFVVFVSALSGSGPAVRGFIFITPLTSSDCSYLGCSALFGLLSLQTDGGHVGADLSRLGAQVNIICLLKHIIVCVAVEVHITYLAPYSQRELNGPKTEDGLGAAAAD